MRLINFAILSIAAAALLVACSDDDGPTEQPTATPAPAVTPAPTATPLARVPEPIIVTDAGLPASGLPSTEESVQYTVESGDTVGGIAERFGVSSDAIRSANEITNDEIFIGQVLTIPRDTATTGDTGSAGVEAPPVTDGSTYVVQPGDTAFGIALEFDTTVEALAAANGMTEDEITDLQIGQVINLPSPQ
ncbi:MAG: LysM peptidoglycan-binding domain-containing protein [Chloroflexi bacterium]|nr:LysM peptidoglycan-binding domain-containing protein [Chloroflexota bacterium]